MKKVFFAALVMINISGCSVVDKMFNENNPKNVLYFNWNDNIASTFVNGSYQNIYNGIDCLSEGEKAKKERNKQLEMFLIGVDSYYYKKKNALITGRGAQNTIADIVQLGLTGAASFAGGGTPNLLAGIATALNGSKLSIDKNLFSDQSSFLIAIKMDQLRLAKFNAILRNKLLDCSAYSLDAAMKDGIEYYYAGTINGALVAIYNETGKQMTSEQKKEEELVQQGYEQSMREKDNLIREKELANEREAQALR